MARNREMLMGWRHVDDTEALKSVTTVKFVDQVDWRKSIDARAGKT